MKKILFLLSACTLLACGGNSPRDIDEREGAKTLAAARKACMDRQFDAARDSIMSLRQNHPLAMEARRQGILLLDSIELFAANDSLVALNNLAQEQYMKCLDDPEAPLFLDSATYVDEHERLTVKIEFFERKLQEDMKKKTTTNP